MQKDSFIRIFGKEIKIENIDFENEIIPRIRELLRADNFSILTGTGSSHNVGSVLFSKDELELENGWIYKELKGNKEYELLLELFKNENKDKIYGVEDFITFLYKLEFAEKLGVNIKITDTKEKKDYTVKIKEIKEKILIILKNKCVLPTPEKNELSDHLNFIRKIISRPINLRRSNLFATNYDLVFEKAMDELGVVYVDGFIGGLKKYFHPESFNFDYYYPAATTEGKVSRMERVLHYYKLHGSLNWIQSNTNDTLNIYGIEKKDKEIIDDENVLIFPTPLKEQDTIGFPYSDLFRRFANTIQQPQSVLITYGYSFGDAHINRIIFEALTIPSFQLIIVSYSWSYMISKIFEKFKDNKSVGFIIGGDGIADWKTFVNKILPDIPSENYEEKFQEKRNNAKSFLNNE